MSLLRSIDEREDRESLNNEISEIYNNVKNKSLSHKSCLSQGFHLGQIVPGVTKQEENCK